MKEFNLEQAKAGKPVCTRDGRKARIICWDKIGDNPIVALIECKSDEIICCYYQTGSYDVYGESQYDLMLASEKHEGWVNIYRVGDDKRAQYIYDTKEKAKKMSAESACYVTTAKIEWEE